ncbi:MAG: hypothetical protein K2W96_01865 [Gemmataceae bacterium]|nr:hypothetical protein [Gemmataceae bacterium]
MHPIEQHVLPFDPAPVAPTNDPVAEPALPVVPVDPTRSAAGREGARRLLELARLGLRWEQEHGLKPGWQRRRQLIQLGKRWEQEHGLRAPRPRRRKKADAWKDLLSALAVLVKPAHRETAQRLLAALADAPLPQAA